MPVPFLVHLAPALIVAEIMQLVVAERYLGKKQIGAGMDPRTLPLREAAACGWSLAILAMWAWMLFMLLTGFAIAQVGPMVLVSLLGYTLRRNCTLRWVLMILTFEGAIRIGMLMSVMFYAWQKP